MSFKIVAFNAEAGLPAYLSDPATAKDLNKDIVTGAIYPTLSIKGKRFAINRDGVKTVIMKPGEDDEIAQSIGVVIQRANMNSKVFYAKRFTEGESDGQLPTCYSLDGVAPSPGSAEPQAKKCQLCPHNVFGSAVAEDGSAGKGKACADSARLAVSTPDKLEDAMLLRVPPASLKNLRDAVKVINQRKVPYNAVVMKIGFDHEAASPKLTFKPVGLVDEEAFSAISGEHYDGDLVRAIVGVDEEPAARPAAPAEEDDEFAAAVAAQAKAKAEAKAKADAAAAEEAAAAEAKAKAAVKAKAEAKAKPAPIDLDELEGVAAPAEPAKPKAAVKAAAAKPSVDMSDLDALLGDTDD